MKIYQRKHKTGTRWCCDLHVTPPGATAPQRYRLTAPEGVTSRSGAERWARERFTQIAASGAPPSTRRAKEAAAARAAQAERERVPTLGEWWPQYAAQLETERRKASGQLARRNQWAWLQPFAEVDLRTCCTDLEVHRVRASIARHPKAVGPRRVNQIVGLLLAMLRRAAQTFPHLELRVPTVKPVRVEPAEVVACYPLADTQAMLEVAELRERALILLMLDAGLRVGEAGALQWCNVDLAGRRVSVRATLAGTEVTSPKSGKPRTVPITQRLAATLDRLQAGAVAPWVFPGVDGPLTANTLFRHVRRVARDAGVAFLGTHALRHTYATESLRAGVDLRTLQMRLGHADITTTAVYLHPSEDAGVDALETRLVSPPREPATVTDLALARERMRQK